MSANNVYICLSGHALCTTWDVINCMSDCAHLVFPSEPDKEDREKIDSDSSSTSDSEEEDCEPAAKYTVRKSLSGDKVPVKRGWHLF